MDFKNKDTTKKLIRVCFYFILFFALYQVILKIGESVIQVFYIGTSMYLLTASILFCIFYAKNGYKLSSSLTKRSDLPESWSEKEKDKYLENEKHKKQQARKILMVLLPMVVTILIDYMTLYAYEIFERLFS